MVNSIKVAKLGQKTVGLTARAVDVDGMPQMKIVSLTSSFLFIFLQTKPWVSGTTTVRSGLSLRGRFMGK